MALPLLMGLGLGLAGGVGFLKGRANEQRAEQQMGVLSDTINQGPWAGTAQGQNLLSIAQNEVDSGGFFENWAGGANETIDGLTASMQQGNMQFAMQQAQQQQAQAAAQQQWMMDNGLDRWEGIETDWTKTQGAYESAQQQVSSALQLAEAGDPTSAWAALSQLSVILGQGALTQAEQDSALNSGAMGFVQNIANQIMSGGKLNETAQAQLIDAISTVGSTMNDTYGNVRSRFAGRAGQWNQNYGESVPGTYALHGVDLTGQFGGGRDVYTPPGQAQTGLTDAQKAAMERLNATEIKGEQTVPDIRARRGR